MLIGHYTIDSAPVESQLKRTLVCNLLIEGMEGVRRVPFLRPGHDKFYRLVYDSGLE